MALACDKLIHVGKVSATNKICGENFSGVGSKLYIFFPEDLNSTPTVDDKSNTYTASSFAWKEGTGAYEIALKPKSGKVTSTSNPNGGGYSNVLTGVVAKDMDKMSWVGRIMNCRNFGAMIADGSGKMIVLYSPDYDVEFSMESDTGDTPDSDHGHTVTITCSPMNYPLMKWEGAPTVAETEAETSFDTTTDEGSEG